MTSIKKMWCCISGCKLEHDHHGLNGHARVNRWIIGIMNLFSAHTGSFERYYYQHWRNIARKIFTAFMMIIMLSSRNYDYRVCFTSPGKPPTRSAATSQVQSCKSTWNAEICPNYSCSRKWIQVGGEMRMRSMSMTMMMLLEVMADYYVIAKMKSTP